jgi:hypothetical protein
VSRERLGDAWLGFAYSTGCRACNLMLAVTTIDAETRRNDREKPITVLPASTVPVRRGVPADAILSLAPGLGSWNGIDGGGLRIEPVSVGSRTSICWSRQFLPGNDDEVRDCAAIFADDGLFRATETGFSHVSLAEAPGKSKTIPPAAGNRIRAGVHGGLFPSGGRIAQGRRRGNRRRR